MALNLYSKETTDTLLAAKLSISSLSNGAATNIDPTAPTNGQVLGYSDATSSLVWLSAGGGGSFLPLAGGAMDTGAVITIANATTDIRYGSDYIGLNLTGSAGSTGATFDYNGISIFDGTNNSNINPTQMLVQDSTQSTTLVPASVAVNNGTTSMTMTATGLTFPDSTTQSTAAVAFSGGSVANPITLGNMTTDSYVGADLLGVELTADSSQNSTLQYDGVRVANGSGTTYVGPTGITFPDSTVQTTAAVAGANLGDVFAMSIVKDVTWTGSGWQLTCEPVNNNLYNSGGMAVCWLDGTNLEWMSGMSTTSTWTYTTTGMGSSDYIAIQCYGQVSHNPVNYV